MPGLIHIAVSAAAVSGRRSASPAIEAVSSGALTAPEGEAHEPKKKEDHGDNPQDVDGKAETKEEQNEQKREEEYHDRSFLRTHRQEHRAQAAVLISYPTVGNSILRTGRGGRRAGGAL
jgi:hypothetical protein